jgi:hypothetical protein
MGKRESFWALVNYLEILIWKYDEDTRGVFIL